MASLAGSLPMRLAAVYGLGAILVTAPVTAADAAAEVERLGGQAIAAVVGGAVGDGFVLDRDGHVLHVARDGSVSWTASLDRYSSPFGAGVGGRVLFGGIHCEGSGCRQRSAQVAVLDAAGELEATLVLDHSSGWPSPLNGLALVGVDGDTVWINGGGTLFRVAVDPARVVETVPWPGGEPCVVGGVLHDLAATGGSHDRGGVALADAATLDFDLHLRTWDGQRWHPVADAARSMPHGQNAYCTPGGYDIRDGATTLARWHPATGTWQPIGPATADPARTTTSSVTTSTRHGYALAADGALLDVTDPESARPTGVVLPGVGPSEPPPALQVDDAGGGLFWCATTYRGGAGLTRCGSPSRRLPAQDQPVPGLQNLPAASGVHHYNLCSSACGSGVRPHTRDLVVWLTARQPPAALSLNEQCYDDHVHLAAHLPAGLDAGAGYTALGTATGCPGAVKQFGNSVWVRSDGPVTTAWGRFPSQATDPCDPRRYECRGVACAQTTDSQVFCSAHLESQRRAPGLAEVQADEYADFVTDRYGPDAPRALAADFNLPHEDVDAVLTPTGARAPTTGPTIGTTTQIDMIYFAPTPSPTATTHCDRQASDHCYVIANAPAGQQRRVARTAKWSLGQMPSTGSLAATSQERTWPRPPVFGQPTKT